MGFKFNPITNRLDLVDAGGGGGGDVSGPGSSTNNAIVRWDGTTGTLIKNSTATLSDTGDIVANSISLSVPLSEVDGGTNQSTYSTGDTLYASAPNTLSRLAIGSTNQVLTVIAGVPSWQTPAASGVTSVSGTANRITSTGGTTPVIDISASYVGQASITTLGTISTGVWNGTTVGPTFGGTGLNSYATGDTIYASAANTLSKLSLSTFRGAGLITNGTNVKWGDELKYLQYVNDFNVASLADGTLFVYDTFAGGGKEITGFQSAAHPGVINLYLTAVASGANVYFNGTQGFKLFAVGAGEISLTYIIKVSSLSTGTDTYNIRMGFGDNFIGDFTDGIYFKYTDSGATPAWIIRSTSGGVSTTQTTSVNLDTNWHNYQIIINAAGTSISFYIDGSQVGTAITTNIPSAFMTPMFNTDKTAGIVQNNTQIDFFKLYYELTTSR